jgi:hypothetical protein
MESGHWIYIWSKGVREFLRRDGWRLGDNTNAALLSDF